VAQEVLAAGGHEAFGERRRLGQEEPGVVVDRGVRLHPLELIDGRDDVEDGQALDGGGMVQRHPVADARAAVVTDDRETLEAELRHEGDELVGPLAVAVALAELAARLGAALTVALEVADDHGVAA
jgi:hypothetical protein